MNKYLKIIFLSLSIIIGCILLDILCIFLLNRPIFAIKVDDDSTNNIYKGLFYDTYYCHEYANPKIKLKGTKFSCSSVRMDIGKVKEIVDTSKYIKDFACAEALEEFYADDNYTYYWNCIKDNYLLVRYTSGYEETISTALKYETISISDLDRYGIDYIKYAKEKIEAIETKNCNKVATLYYEDNDKNIYTYCLDNVIINIGNERQELKDYFKNNKDEIDNVISKLKEDLMQDSSYWSDGSMIYKDGGSRLYTNTGMSMLICNTIDGNKDIYIGHEDMRYEDGFCK